MVHLSDKARHGEPDYGISQLGAFRLGLRPIPTKLLGRVREKTGALHQKTI